LVAPDILCYANDGGGNNEPGMGRLNRVGDLPQGIQRSKRYQATVDNEYNEQYREYVDHSAKNSTKDQRGKALEGATDRIMCQNNE